MVLDESFIEFTGKEGGYLGNELKKMFREKITIFPSEANYLLLKTDVLFYKKLLEHGILIRDCSNYRGLGNGYYRIAVKGHEENAELVCPIDVTEKLPAGQRREMIEYILPEQIEKRSFEIIEKELAEKGIVLPAEQAPVTKRVIHTSEDFDYAKTLAFSKDAVETAKRLIKNGADGDQNLLLQFRLVL